MDEILESFLAGQFAGAMEAVDMSDLVDLHPVEGTPPHKCVLELRCNTLVRRDGNIVECNRSLVGVSFLDDYLRNVNPFQLLTWLGPPEIFAPNIAPPFICIGPVKHGTRLVELIHRIFDVVSFQDVNVSESDSLNKTAAQWCRQNMDRLPVDSRPLKRRTLQLQVEHVGKGEE